MILRILYISILFLFSISAHAQEIKNSDFETRNALQVNYKIDKQFKLKFTQEGRFKNNSTQLDKFLTNLESQYKHNKNSTFALGLRYSGINDNEGNTKELESHFRYYIDYLFEYDFYDFTIEYRLRYQKSNQINKNIFEGDYPNKNLRGKTSATYNISNWKLDPIGSIEMFYRRQIGELNGFDKWRIKLGTDYKFNKNWKLTLFYFREKEYRIWNPTIINGVNLKLTHYMKRNSPSKDELLNNN